MFTIHDAIERYPGFDKSSKSTVGARCMGPCMESLKIKHGDLVHVDTELEIKSGDLVFVETEDGLHVVRLECVGLINPADPSAGPGPTWWRKNDQGMIPLAPSMRVAGRLVLVLHRNPKLPLIEPEIYASLSVSEEWKSQMMAVAAPAYAAIERDGPDRTTVFRSALT